MKKFLSAPVLILSLCSYSMESPVDSDGKKATLSTVVDALPKGWRIEEIAKAALPSAHPKNTHVLVWKRIEDERPLLVESCLVVCRISEDSRRDRWFLVSLYRHPREPSKDWTVSWVRFNRGANGCIEVVHRRGYKNRPSNKEIYGFMDEIGWCFGADDGFKLLGGAVYKTTWETVVKEKPTRDFKK